MGDLIDYDAKVEDYTGSWRVLGAENGNLLILSENVASLYLYGLNGNKTTTQYGLLNAKEGLDNICSIYKNGVGAVASRSINIEDLNRIVKYNPERANKNRLSEYGNKVTYTWSTTESGKLDFTSTNNNNGTTDAHNNGFYYIDFNTMTNTKVKVDEEGLPTLTSDAYTYNIETLSNSTKVSDMLSTCWLASCCTEISRAKNYYCMRILSGSSVSYIQLYYSLGNISYKELGVRAVVELSSLINIKDKDKVKGWTYSI